MTDCAYPVLSDIYLDDKAYGMRTWHHVPRVGDEIVLRDNSDQPMLAAVRRVVWHESRSRIYDCQVRLYCELVPA